MWWLLIVSLVVVGVLAGLFLAWLSANKSPQQACASTSPPQTSYMSGVLAELVDPYPESLTLTWRSAINTALSTAYVPYKGVYKKVNSIDIASFDAEFVEAFGTLTCYQVYQNSRKLAFVKYQDDAGAKRFALLGILDSVVPMTITVSTADDVGVSKDPSTYNGAWSYTYNNVTGSATTYIDVSSSFV